MVTLADDRKSSHALQLIGSIAVAVVIVWLSITLVLGKIGPGPTEGRDPRRVDDNSGSGSDDGGRGRGRGRGGDDD